MFLKKRIFNQKFCHFPVFHDPSFPSLYLAKRSRDLKIKLKTEQGRGIYCKGSWVIPFSKVRDWINSEFPSCQEKFVFPKCRLTIKFYKKSFVWLCKYFPRLSERGKVSVLDTINLFFVVRDSCLRIKISRRTSFFKPS